MPGRIKTTPAGHKHKRRAAGNQQLAAGSKVE